ncbi:MAG: 4-(cytidine 5'-diphospho)-2-C-methyl-D-erythritol kinase [Bacteroidales bacterium]|nr:4-(cytidine 5'-diphospho)-2-C-methyl-D-erythritol kinase [Bacteroidales bacterium]
MITFPNAKINLGLNIVNRRADGYHDIETVFYPIPLADTLEIVPAKGTETTLTCYGRAVDCPPEKNLVMKAYRLLQEAYNLPAVDIYLVKCIPDGAGLGGGSSDASFCMKMLNEMFALGLSNEQLAAMAAKIGADCPFFIYNKPMMATGIGDEFGPVEVNLHGKHLLLVKPDVSVPTKAAYAQVTPAPAAKPIPSILVEGIEGWQAQLVNDFERSVFAQYPSLAAIKQALLDSGAQYAAMSGSGSSIFGIYDSAELAETAAKQFEEYSHYVMHL